MTETIRVSRGTHHFKIPADIFAKHAVSVAVAPKLVEGVPYIEYHRYVHDDRSSHDACITTVSVLQPDGSVHIGWSLCRNGDQFSRKIGRSVATERLSEAPYVIGVEDAADLHHFESITEYLQVKTFKEADSNRSSSLPTRLRDIGARKAKK